MYLVRVLMFRVGGDKKTPNSVYDYCFDGCGYYNGATRT
ncbi:MAG: hypothetical protein ACJA1S_001393 [Cellvibrionaceae bacterium]|jgi:hypothetical protein